MGNRVWNGGGILAQITSCQGCSVEDNEAFDLAGDVILSAAGDMTVDECTDAPGGTCLPSEGTVIAATAWAVRRRRRAGAGERVRRRGAGAGERPRSGDNVYCAPTGAHRFGWAESDGTLELVPYDEWVTLSGTDGSSSALAEDDPACAGP